MKSILVTGANRGIGLGMVKYLSKRENPPKYIIAATRKPKTEELQELAASHRNIHVLSLDLTKIDEFDNFAQNVRDLVGVNGLNVLINNAGISSKFTTIKYVKTNQLLDGFTVNTIAPIMLTKSFLSLLKQAATNNTDKPLGIHKSAVINISSILGSIHLNDRGGFYPYRCSKAALNCATKSMSIDLKDDNIMVISMHPGWVKTDLGGKSAPMDVETSVEIIFNTIEQFSTKHNGKFYQYDGKELEW